MLSYSLSKAKKAIIPLGVATLGLAVYQGVNLRLDYIRREKLEPPNGAQSGLEKWVDKLKEIKDDMVQKVPDGKKIREKFKKLRDAYELQNQKEKYQEISIYNDKKEVVVEKSFDILQDQLHRSNPEIPIDGPINGKKVKLLVMGDSLVAGVGCESLQASPILPKVLAKMLSYALKTDVEWHSAGKVGATVSDLRKSIFPALREQILQEILSTTNSTDNSNDDQDDTIEYAVVVICGLNDWRTMIERFPHGLGPYHFRLELQRLVHEIQDSITTYLTQQHPHHHYKGSKKVSVKVFLPRLPLTCLESDPSCTLTIAPLRYVVKYLCYLFDNQKQTLALEEKTGDVYYLDSPSLTTVYATPGMGNTSSDGVHPSNQGYTWWAVDLAEKISMAYRDYSRGNNNSKSKKVESNSSSSRVNSSDDSNSNSNNSITRDEMKQQRRNELQFSQHYH